MEFTTTSSPRTDSLKNTEKNIVPAQRKKLVIIGDRACGKTSILRAFIQQHTAVEYVPKILEYSVVDVKLAGKDIELALWNTAGQEHFDRLCNILYPGTDVAILCFSFDKPESLESVVNKWAPAVNKTSKKIPIILVGTKVDLRHDFQVFKQLQKFKKEAVRTSKARAVAERIKAFCYLECSAKNNVGIQEIFQNAIRAIIASKKQRTRYKNLFSNKG